MIKHFLFITFFLLFSCGSKNNDIIVASEQKNTPKNDSVFIKIKLKKGAAVNLKVSNSFLEPRILDGLVDGNSFNLHVGDELSYIHVFKDIMHDSGVYVKKGDSLEISYSDGKFSFGRLRNKNYADPNLNLYSDYYDYVKKEKPFEEIYMEEKDAAMHKDMVKSLNLNKKLYKVRSKFIKRYKKRNQIESIYTDSFLNQYKFRKLNLDYWDIKTLGNEEQLTEKYSEILEFFKTEKIQAEMIPQLFDIIFDYCETTAINFNNSNHIAALAENFFRSVKHDFDGRNRDLLLLRLFRSGRSKESFLRFYNEFKIFAHDESFVNRAKELIAGNPYGKESVTDEETLIKDIKGKETTVKDILKKYKGKAVYLNFWASWCAPCRLEIPKSLTASKKYKNVKFIYISTDENDEQWKKANNKILSDHGESYRLIDENSSKFIQEINLSLIPRRIIFNEQGEIADKDAPGANEVHFESVLNQYSE